MLYTHANTKKASVFDVDTKEEFHKVLEVDTDTGIIKIHRTVLDFENGRFLSDTIRFRSIYAIQGKEGAPCLFHCYGRIN